MNRKQAKELLPLIKAFAEGKAIQAMERGEWKDVDHFNLAMASVVNYRIKPKPKYRPFQNAEECWQEMQKHQPFGWLKAIRFPVYQVINYVDNIGVNINSVSTSFDKAMEHYTFSDGTPFGVKETSL